MGNAVLAVLLVINCLHCWYGEARVLAFQAHQQYCATHHKPMPLDPLRGACHNESGCICHGATLVATFDADAAMPEVSQLEFFLASAHDSAFQGDLPAGLAAAGDLPQVYGISGRMLRTQFTSFLN